MRKTGGEAETTKKLLIKGHDSPRMKEGSFSHGEKVALGNKQGGPEKLMQRTVIEAKRQKNYVHHTNGRPVPEQNGAC